MLELKDVSFRYTKKDPYVLDGISLSLGRGEFVAVSGRNGSGKTTVTRLLTGLEYPASGNIFFDGMDITCLLYTSDAADEEDSVDLGGRRIIKKKKKKKFFFFFFLFFFFFFFFKQKTAYEM